MSANANPSTWRLQTLAGASLIPTKILSRSGTFEPENATATEVYIMEADRLIEFAIGSFPPALIVGNFVQHRPNRALPGSALAMTTKRISWEGLSGDDKPVDPFQVDTDAPAGTYEQYVKVTVEFGTTTFNSETESDPSDPKTFLEVSAQASGTFITATTMGKARWGKTKADGGDVAGREIPQGILQPEVEWNLRWSQIPWDFFNDELATRLRDRLGKVNDRKMEIFFDAPKDTILFVGWSAQQQYTWRNGFIGKPPLTLDLKFLERNFKTTTGIQVTHQHQYRPDTSQFELLYVDGTQLSFGRENLENIFSE